MCVPFYLYLDLYVPFTGVQAAESAQHHLYTLLPQNPRRYLILSYLSFAVYVLGIPLLLTGLVWSMRKYNKMAQPRVLLRM